MEALTCTPIEKIYFTSDLHFGHNKEFLYKPRGFNSIEEHDEEVIKRWNEIVTNNDVVFILGDLMLNDKEHGIECLKMLNGRKKFIIGNHDTKSKIELYKEIMDCHDYSAMVDYKKYKFYLSHYPTITEHMDLTNRPLKKRVINLFGHTHQDNNFYKDNPFMYHVGLDSHNCYPVCIDQIIEDIQNKINELVINGIYFEAE